MWKENCVNIRRYHKTVVEVCGTWCTKNDSRLLFPNGAIEAIKWSSEIHRSSEKCIYFQTQLFVPSLKVLLERF